jgi:amidase
VTTFLLRLDPGGGDGPTVAVKDLIDVAGTPTSCASRPVAGAAGPAAADATCIERIRAGGGRIVGKVNLHELAFGGSGINPYTGTPQNPLDPARIPGGSSSGSAVAVATGQADVALGTDTAGSVRIPSTCCGVVGLKTTFGRIPTDGVQPLAPSLDTVGPMATTVAGVVTGMALLEAGFAPGAPAPLLGRFRLPGAHPGIEAAVDHLLATSGLDVVPADLSGWERAAAAGTTILFGEAARVHAALMRDHADQLGDETRDRLVRGAGITDAALDAARAHAEPWRAELDAALARTPVIATAGIMDEPPLLTEPERLDTRAPNVAVNLAGNPAIVVPVARPGHLPTAVQLIGRRGEEEVLVATAAVLEAASAA